MAPGVSLEEQLKLQFENRPVQIFSTCPQSSVVDRSQYLAQVAEVSRWSEQAGCTGILVYTDNSLVDPWLVAQIVIQSTREALSAGSHSARVHASGTRSRR